MQFNVALIMNAELEKNVRHDVRIKLIVISSLGNLFR